MKHPSIFQIILILTLTISAQIIFAQNQNVGIGTTTPDATAKLDIVASDKGILIPRTDTSALNAAGTPATGLTIYQTSDNKYYYYDGGKWVVIAAGTNPVFERNGTTIRQTGNYNTDDFLLGSDALPANGVITSDTLLFFDRSKAAFRAGRLYYSPDWSPDSIGYGSFAFGTSTKARGNYTAAWGKGSTASGLRSTAWGNQSTASGEEATAWGYNSTVSGEDATAWGWNTAASALCATAWGRGTKAKSYTETAIGLYNTDYTPNSTTTWDENDRLFQIGNGTSVSARSNALTLYKNGDFILNSDTLPANGVNTSDTLLFFDKSKFAFRAGQLYNSPNWSPDSIGYGSFAFGYNTKANGDYSAAWGIGSTTSGYNSTAWGYGSTSSGTDATAWGYGATASAYDATAWGYGSTASGDISTAWGIGTKARAYAETVFGQYNHNLTPGSTTEWTNNDVLFVVGNGTSSSSLHNALTLWQDGRLGLGDAYEPNHAFQLPNNTVVTKGKALANAWDTYSDSRIKFNQKSLTYGLNEIMKLKPKSYIQHGSNFEEGRLKINENEGQATIGMIAQEVYKVIPEAANKPEDESKELWSMDYEKLIPVLVKAVQEQQDIIDELKDENTTLKTQLENIEQRLSKLENK